MKFHETHFEEYIQTNDGYDLHPKWGKNFENLPKDVKHLRNIIFHGPNGVGKYTQMLRVIKKYSPSELKYEKKISVLYNKQPYFLKISDIHYEVDMSLLGCNSKMLWHEIYQQVIDIICAKTEKIGIIVCKNFHDIHSELLDNFYSYMQETTIQPIHIVFFLVTKEVSFLPDNILHCCELIPISRPKKYVYTKCFRKKINQWEEVNNMKHLFGQEQRCIQNYKIICEKIMNSIIRHPDEAPLLHWRDLLYDILIYNLDMGECISYFISLLIKENRLPREKITPLLVKTYTFFQYYNNNYRPIYHLEQYFIYVSCLVNKYIEN